MKPAQVLVALFLAVLFAALAPAPPAGWFVTG